MTPAEESDLEYILEICVYEILNLHLHTIVWRTMDKMNQVLIPNVDRDERIGSSFNHLFQVINETQKTNCDKVIWDFGECSFLHPFFLAPLGIYKKQCGKEITLENVSPNLRSYFNSVSFEVPKGITSVKELEDLRIDYQHKSYIPICSVANHETNLDKVQTVIQSIIEQQSDADTRIKTPLSYFLGELFCNIEQHSDSKIAYVFAQTLPKDGLINLCIADEGITIYGSYVKTGRYLETIGNSHALALDLAKDGHSTKDLPETENRGYGISSTRKMLVEGLGGSFFIYSGKAFYRHTRQEERTVELPDVFNWKGTIIFMKVPTTVPKEFDYTKYIY